MGLLVFLYEHEALFWIEDLDCDTAMAAVCSLMRLWITLIEGKEAGFRHYSLFGSSTWWVARDD